MPVLNAHLRQLNSSKVPILGCEPLRVWGQKVYRANISGSVIDGDGKPDGGVGGFGSLYNLFEREIRQIGENPENQQKLPSEPTEKLNGQYCFANQ